MRTTEKDILMICKGHYSDKYKTLEEALGAYYRKHYSFPKEKIPTLSYKFMLSLWFNNCVKEFLQPDTMHSFWLYVIKEEAYQEKRWMNENGCTEFYEVLYHRIVTWLVLLDVRDKNGNWKIDLSDYEEVEFVI